MSGEERRDDQVERPAPDEDATGGKGAGAQGRRGAGAQGSKGAGEQGSAGPVESPVPSPLPPCSLAPLPPGAPAPADTLPRRHALVDLVAASIGIMLAVPLAGLLFGPLRRRRKGQEWVRVGPVGEFTPGVYREVELAYLRYDAWLPSTVKRRVVVAAPATAGGPMTVFSTKCTHLGCGVQWDDEQRRFLCPCHGGVYDAEGRPVSGPLPRPLERLAARVTDGQLEVREA